MTTTKPVGETGTSSYELKANRMTNRPRLQRYNASDRLDSDENAENAENAADDAVEESGDEPQELSQEVVLDPCNIKVPVAEVTTESANTKNHSPPKSAMKKVSDVLKGSNADNIQVQDVIIAQFDNPAFEPDLVTSQMSFAEVVRRVMQEPIETDYHPFGRGNLYESVIDERPKLQRDDGRLFIWILVAAIVLGLAGGVIVMSIAYESKRAQSVVDSLTENVTNVTDTSLR